jgi:hypothetical protein
MIIHNYQKDFRAYTRLLLLIQTRQKNSCLNYREDIMVVNERTSGSVLEDQGLDVVKSTVLPEDMRFNSAHVLSIG